MTSIERGLNCANKISKARRILDWSTEKLGKSNQSNGHGQRNNEEAIWQEKVKSTRTKGRRWCMVGSQKHLFEQTFKEARPEKIQIF